MARRQKPLPKFWRRPRSRAFWLKSRCRFAHRVMTALSIPLSSPDITEAEIAAVSDVLRSGRLSLGPELPAFEQALAHWHEVPEAIAVSSGTAALHLALVALGIGPGDEVIVP